jgi:hypothetical protein
VICFICFVYTAVFVVLEQKIAIQVSYWGLFALVLSGFLADKVTRARHLDISKLPVIPTSVAEWLPDLRPDRACTRRALQGMQPSLRLLAQ